MNSEYIRLCSIPAVQERIRERMGEWQVRDSYYSPGWDEIYVDPVGIIFDSDDLVPETIDAIRLPQVHDLNDEKRGLWGMVDWSKLYGQIHFDGTISISHRPKNEHDFGDFRVTDTPEIALLRALMWQWRIEP